MGKNACRLLNTQLRDLLEDAELHSSSLRASYCSTMSPAV